MDRRQVLVGMTAVGLAGPLNLGQLLSAQSSEPQASESLTAWPPPGLAHFYDPETRKLLGPVKMCIKESPGWVHTSEYVPDRKLIAFSFEHDGKIDRTLSDSFSETHDAQGHLLSNRWAKEDGTFGETVYDYDEAGRRRAITNNQNSDRIEYLYDARGIMTSIDTFDPKTIERTRNGAFAGSAWHAAEHGFGVPMGGRVITSYDKRENPVEMRILTADGQLVGQLARKYDASGRLEEEKTLQQNLGFLMLERMTPEQKASITPEQAQDLIKGVNARLGKLPPETKYKYDAQGRLIEKRERNMPFAHTTTIDYNDRGDIERKRETFTDTSVIIRNELPDADVHYSYQYDSYGNWTERTMTVANNGSSVSTSRTRRVLAYY
jgi:YD repeat-containing protein